MATFVSQEVENLSVQYLFGSRIERKNGFVLEKLAVELMRGLH